MELKAGSKFFFSNAFNEKPLRTLPDALYACFGPAQFVIASATGCASFSVSCI